MPALEGLRGLRVIADAGSLDSARWSGAPDLAPITVLRFAPDDAFAVGATTVEVEDEYAVVAHEHGFVGGWCATDAIRPHLEWSLPAERPVLAQGSIAGVPAKLWLPGEGEGLLVTAAAHAVVLAERLGWSRP